MTLSWEDKDSDDKKNLLDRNITFTISKNSSDGTYGVTKIDGFVEVRYALLRLSM